MQQMQRSVKSWHPNIFARIIQKARKITAKLFRKKINADLKNRIKSNDFTLICSFCAAGVIYHDLDMQFLSPTINLAFDGPDFIRFCRDIPKYTSMELKEYIATETTYPIGILGDIKIKFIHYKTFEEARKKWQERCERINFDKILIIANDRDGMNDVQCMSDFDTLPYPKIMYTSKEYENYSWSVYCPEFKKHSCVGVLTGYVDFKGNRYYEKHIDIADFLNSAEN